MSASIDDAASVQQNLLLSGACNFFLDETMVLFDYFYPLTRSWTTCLSGTPVRSYAIAPVIFTEMISPI